MSEVAPLRRVVVKHPDDAVRDAAAIAEEARALNYAGTPDLDRARTEYEAFVRLIADEGADVLRLPRAGEAGLDSIYARDASVVSPRGMILASMGKAERSGEPAAQARAFAAWGTPVAGIIQPPGRLEGGDVVWLDDRIVAVDELIEVPLPHWRGPADVFHLMSILSPVDYRLTVVYSPLMPVPFRERLLDLGFDFIEVPTEEFDSMGANVLALEPRYCVMLAGNPRTRERLEQAGVRVRTYEGREISIKGGGGPTCLTRPVARDADGRKPQDTIPLSNTASVPLRNSTHSA